MKEAKEPNSWSDLKRIREIDTADMLKAIRSFPMAFLNAIGPAKQLKIDYDPSIIDKILICGIGGSAIAGDVFRDVAQYQISKPVVVGREERLPLRADRGSLVIVASYSGETSESLMCLNEAYESGSKIVCITSGGTLHELANRIRVPTLILPSGLTSRAAFPYFFTSIVSILNKAGFKIYDETSLIAASNFLKSQIGEFDVQSPVESNLAKKAAQAMFNTLPILYASSHLVSVAYRMKCQLNEIAKVFAKDGSFPEICHNEVEGFNDSKPSRQISVVLLRSIHESGVISESIKLFRDQLSAAGVSEIMEVWARGRNILEEALWTTLFGDYSSFYLSMLRQVDPTRLERVSKIRSGLDQLPLKREIRERLTTRA